MKQQDVIEFFDQAAAGWDAQLRRNEPVIARILDNAGVRSGVRVLDVACGTGVLIPDYLQRGAAQVTAIDISPEMARIAREKFPQENVTVLCGDAEQAHFPAPFDCIVIYNAFPHFPEPERLLAHLAGLLAPGAGRAPREDRAAGLERDPAGAGAGGAVFAVRARDGADLRPGDVSGGGTGCPLTNLPDAV